MLDRFDVGSTQDLRKYAGEIANDSVAPLTQDVPLSTSDARFGLGLDCLRAGFAAKRPVDVYGHRH